MVLNVLQYSPPDWWLKCEVQHGSKRMGVIHVRA